MRFPPPLLQVGVGRNRGRRCAGVLHARLDVDVRDHRRLRGGIAEEPGHAARRRLDEERSEQTRIPAGGGKQTIAARVLAAKTRVDDELDRVGTERADGRQHLVGELALARIDDERALVAGLDDDVGAIADHHVDAIADRKDVHVAVARRGRLAPTRLRLAAWRG